MTGISQSELSPLSVVRLVICALQYSMMEQAKKCSVLMAQSQSCTKVGLRVMEIYYYSIIASYILVAVLNL